MTRTRRSLSTLIAAGLLVVGSSGAALAAGSKHGGYGVGGGGGYYDGYGCGEGQGMSLDGSFAQMCGGLLGLPQDGNTGTGGGEQDFRDRYCRTGHWREDGAPGPRDC